jgi:TonB-dependent starch-binding outer membrane protein SusC
MRYLPSRSGLWIPALAALSASCAPATAPFQPKSSADVTADELDEYDGQPIERVLERKVPGITVKRAPDGRLLLRIRGSGLSEGGHGAPLFIVNGLPMEPGPGGALPNLNPHDIESIRVLKGVDAAIYGIDGGNGVIEITMKGAGKRNRD